MTEIQRMIASARRQAADIEADEISPETEAQRTARLLALERARQLREWADFAELPTNKECLSVRSACYSGAKA